MTSCYAAVGYTMTPDDHHTELNWTDPDTYVEHESVSCRS
jgi:hypothetical protein